ncbi:XRE family transcriptional regulator [Actinomadura graeca]|uniref:XRE family transcriptional regulator n=1 Tax=Actinomadura graeca TaxID=2750812 RepID=A0ABX8R7N2_9ACTN|nr:helix-turn-helix domain-containing protein [Actinomadura graeca]QXJ25737.1 XRE family transcriptional regulator [Actinomadura graeca]
MSVFGDAVRVARKARGWTQGELAVNVGVAQRTVSSWERGVSEPPDDTKVLVARVLSLPSGVWPRTAGAGGFSGRARLAELPFETLTAEEFEDFSLTLARRSWPGMNCYRVGKTGHTQGGFDVHVEDGTKLIVGIQCKRESEFGPAKVIKADEGVKERAGLNLIFLSRTATPGAQTEARMRGWQIWDKNKLSHVVHDLHLSESVPIVDRYFPLLRESFLGVLLPGPWLDPSQYFGRLDRSERSSQRWTLVGRQALVEELKTFTGGPSGRVAVVVGRGGIGKTRLVRALCDDLEETEVAIRFLERDSTVDRQGFEQLPPGSLLLVVDDAHDDGVPVGKVVAGIFAVNPSAKVLLTSRPDGEARIRRELRAVGADLPDTLRLDVPDLDREGAETLAREILGASSEFAARRLAHIAWDSPFLLVIGCIAVREGVIDPGRFEGDNELRRELIGSLVDSIARAPTDQTDTREEVLRAVAALQPVRTGDGEFREALARLTGRPFDQLLPHLTAWEDVGIMLRRGQSYRIVPDLLGDAILARAALMPQTPSPTGYLERVREVADGQALVHLLVNASRVDWQESPPRRGHLVVSLWESLSAEFRHGDAAARQGILSVLAKVAFYQPRPVLELVEWAMEHPAQKAGLDAGFGLLVNVTDEEVRQAAAPVLRAAAYDLDAFDQAVLLLWELARDDARLLNRTPDHGMRLLEGIAGFDRRGITVYQLRLPALIERILGRPRRTTDVHEPLTILHPLLAADAHEQTWSRHTLTYRPFLIDPDAEPVVALREQVIDLAFAQLAEAEPRRVVAAVETIGAALSPPRGGYGLEVTEQMRAPWYRHFASTLLRLRAVLGSVVLSPAVYVVLRKELEWSAERGPGDVRLAARQVLGGIPRRPEHEVARALHNGPADPPADQKIRTFLDRQNDKEEALANCVEAIIDLADNEVIDLIERSLRDLRLTLNDDGHNAHPFLWSLITARPAVGRMICERVANAPDGPLSPLMHTVVSALAKLADPYVIGLGQHMLAAGDLVLARSIAHGFGIQRGRSGLLEGETALLRALMQYPDPTGIVQAATIGAVHAFEGRHRELAAELLTCAPSGQKIAMMDELALILGPHGSFAWSDLEQHHRDEIFRTLRDVPSFDDSYHLLAFLAQRSRDEPIATLELLIARVAKSHDGANYRPLPDRWHDRLHFQEHDDYPDLLRRVRERLASSPNLKRMHYYGSQLFSAVAGSFNAQTRQVITEYLDQPDPIRMEVVAIMLRGAPRDLAWDLPFVRSCFRAADACGQEQLREIQSALFRSVTAGESSADLGQPFPEDIERQKIAHGLADQAIPGSPEEGFYRALARDAASSIRQSLAEDDMPSDDREW